VTVVDSARSTMYCDCHRHDTVTLTVSLEKGIKMEDDYKAYVPLEERIYAIFSEKVVFKSGDVLMKFPQDHPRSIYRALNNLEKTNRIRFLHWEQRKKVYTTNGISNLPMYKRADGSVITIGELIEVLPSWYDENGHLIPMATVDKVFPALMMLFVFAQDDDLKKMKSDWNDAHDILIAAKGMLDRLSENIGAILRHPSMQGDMEVFKKVFNSEKDKAVPDAHQLLRFRTWLEKLPKPKQKD
jgi:hypothetical protein